MSGKVTHCTGCILGLIRYEATIGHEFETQSQVQHG